MTRRDELRVLVTFALLLYWAESVLVFVPPPVSALGILLHIAIMVTLVWAANRRYRGTRFARLLLGLGLVLLIRLLSLALLR